MLTIRIIGEARTVSLNRGEADIAIRLSRPEEGDLKIVKLGEISFRLYTRSDYLAATKEKDWRFIGYDVSSARPPQQAALEEFAAKRPFWRARELPRYRVSWGCPIRDWSRSTGYPIGLARYLVRDPLRTQPIDASEGHSGSATGGFWTNAGASLGSIVATAQPFSR